mmetsp:Transcript_4086/g.7543  ORF Transcript_4086/g.7543 Transcript_4086/m.7543 type:complete len:293 (-) Transcript_4086:174-1052(-)
MDLTFIHGTFNVFRVGGDIAHAVALMLAFYKVGIRREAACLSAKTQALYFLVFFTRYLDIFSPGGYLYNTMFKLYYLSMTPILFVLIFIARRDWGGLNMRWESYYQKKKDTFVIMFVLIPSVIFGYIATPSPTYGVQTWDESMVGMMWTFSIFLESFALLPQYVMFYRLEEKADDLSFSIVAMLGFYRVLYLINWIMKFSIAGAYVSRYHIISAIGGIGNLAFYIDFWLHRLMAESPAAALVRKLDGTANEIAEEIAVQLQVVNRSSTIKLTDEANGGSEKALLVDKDDGNV